MLAYFLLGNGVLLHGMLDPAKFCGMAPMNLPLYNCADNDVNVDVEDDDDEYYANNLL